MEGNFRDLALYVQQLGAQMTGAPTPTFFVPPAPAGPSPVSFTSPNHANYTFVDVDVTVVVGHRAAVVVGHRAAVVAGLRADGFLAGLGKLPVQGRCCRNFHFQVFNLKNHLRRVLSHLLCSISPRRPLMRPIFNKVGGAATSIPPRQMSKALTLGRAPPWIRRNRRRKLISVGAVGDFACCSLVGNVKLVLDSDMLNL